jgi:hypothetical protein
MRKSKYARRRRFWNRVCLASLLLILACTFGLAQTLEESRLNQASIDEASEQLREFIVNSVEQVGGDLETQRLHLVLGFSTGHFAIDPLRAQAARAVAWTLVRDLNIRGDQVSVYAWEMEVWDQPGAERNPLTIPGNLETDKQVVNDLFPLITKAGSKGGHDTELTITQIAEELENANSAVMVLFTNRAASISTDLQTPVIGQNDSRYQSVLESWRRLGQVNESGASLEVSFEVIRPNGDTVTRSFDTVLLVPQRFAGPPIAEGTRSELLAQASPTPAAPATRPGGLFVLLILGLIVAGGAYLIFGHKGSGRGVIFEIGGRTYDLSNLRPGEEICHLAGENYLERDEARTVVVPGGTPPIRLARFVRNGRGVQVENEHFQLDSVDDVTTTAPFTLKAPEEHELEFSGEYAEPGMPARRISKRIRTRLGQGA